MTREVFQFMNDESRKSWLQEETDPSEDAFSWEIHSDTVDQLLKIDALLRSKGLIAHVGLEIEFGLDKPSEGDSKWKLVRDKLIRDLDSSKIPKQDQKNALAFLQNATAADIAIFQVYQSDLKLLLDGRFRKKYDRDTLYDAENVIELQTVPLEIKDLAITRELLIKEIKKQAQVVNLLEGGGEDHVPTYHINVSFSDKDGNLFSQDHPKFLTIGKVLAEGMAYSLSRSLMFHYSEHDFVSKNTKSSTLGVSRKDNLRSTSGRIEVSYTNDSSREQDVEIITLLSLTGALYGIDNLGDHSDIRPAEIVHSPSVSCVDKKMKVLSHALNGCYVDATGHFVFNRFYIKDKLEILLYELGIIEKLPEETAMGQLVSSLIMPKELNGMLEFFSKITIRGVGDEVEIIFPEDEDGIWWLVVPEIGMSSIPRWLRKRIRAGNEITADQQHKYVLGGQRIPRAEVRKKIDIERLKTNLKLNALVPKFRVYEPANEFENLRSGDEAISQRYADFLSNKSIDYLTDDYKEKLYKLVASFIEKVSREF